MGSKKKESFWTITDGNMAPYFMRLRGQRTRGQAGGHGGQMGWRATQREEDCCRTQPSSVQLQHVSDRDPDSSHNTDARGR